VLGLRSQEKPNHVGTDTSEPVVLIVHDMSIGKHALMQDARKQNTSTLLPIEQDVLAMLMTAQARTNFITESA